VNQPHAGGGPPLYLAVDNRNIEGGDYPVRKGDMDHLDFIKKVLDEGADVNARMKDIALRAARPSPTRWLDENVATASCAPRSRATSRSCAYCWRTGADPKIATVGDVTALQSPPALAGWMA